MPFDLGNLGSLSKTTPNVFVVDGRSILVCWNGQQWCAIENRCPHRDAPLEDGAIIGNEIICPLHAARFELTTGRYLNEPATANIAVYPLIEQGDQLLLPIVTD